MSYVNPARPNGPIPGENFTSDERNWPWHRPPEITDIDDALDKVVTDLSETDLGFRYMTLLESGVSVAAVTDIIVTTGVGRGLWTPDFALLLAGPTARLLTIMAKTYNIDYEMGLDTEPALESAETIKYFTRQDSKEANQAVREEAEDIKQEEDVQSAPTAEEGFMAPAPSEEQEMMLGYGPDEEETEEEVPEE